MGWGNNVHVNLNRNGTLICALGWGWGGAGWGGVITLITFMSTSLALAHTMGIFSCTCTHMMNVVNTWKKSRKHDHVNGYGICT